MFIHILTRVGKKERVGKKVHLLEAWKYMATSTSNVPLLFQVLSMFYLM